MSTAVALSVDGMNVADAMGFAAPQQQQQSELWRINALVKQGVEAGKIKSTPMFRVRKGDEEVYSEKLSIRLFAERSQWTKWDSEVNNTQKTVLAANLNSDMKDTLGGFNLGRPTGFVKDFDALPEATKQVMRSVKRTKVFMGLVSLDNPTNEDGDSVEFAGEVPFVFDVKNPSSLKAINSVTSALVSKAVTPIENVINLAATEHAMPNGNKFAQVTATLGAMVGFSEGDNTLLRDFMAYVERTNVWVLSKWDENNVATISREDASIVGSIIDVQDFE
jgi:hypothetical protein|tara:strand:+ start:3671 stop:4504 length:834 start_codon:yes stop_codon:yes gene_type:complete